MIVSEAAVDTVLVFQADPEFRDRLDSLLRHEGFQVLLAQDVVSAIRRLQDLPGAIDWLVVDLDALGPCPVVHVVHEYRFFHPLRPVVALTEERVSDEASRTIDVVLSRRDDDPAVRLVSYLVEFRMLRAELTY